MISARRDSLIEDYHGTPVADPYRWLEDPASPETQAWVTAQNAATQAWLTEHSQRTHIQERLTELLDYPKQSTPTRRGHDLYYNFNSGLQNQAVLYQTTDSGGTPRVIIDPNTLSDDGTAALTTTTFTADGALLAYSIAEHGSDWQIYRVRRTADGADLPDELRYCRFTSIAWLPDNSGFYYLRFRDPATVPMAEQSLHGFVCFHRLGTQQSDDVTVYARSDQPKLLFNPEITEDGQYLILTVWEGTDPRNRVYYWPLRDQVPVEQEFCVHLLDDFDATYTFLGNEGPVFYFLTTNAAPLRRIIAIDTRNPEPAAWREIVPQGQAAIEFAHYVQQTFIVVTLRDVHHEVRRYAAAGEDLGEIALPGIGALVGLSGRAQDTDVFLSYTSFLQPPTIYRYDLTTTQLTPWPDAHATRGPGGFDPADYVTEQVFYPSRDGTRIPMFLTYRRGLTRDGSTPTLLYGYGGFNVTLTPAFSPSIIYWLEHGGIYAVANLRGGGEYGEEWHAAGTLERKQNVFDDFISAAQWLISAGYTRRDRLAIEGGSNGGLLVAACEVQRPDLFGAVICRVPVIDMLRYHRFTVGRFWVSDYGDAEQNADHFRFLYAYSPLHNVRTGVPYPPTLILSADTDDRVVPAHAKKFAATLQWAQNGPAPILLRVETKAGHGMGKPTAKVIEELVDKFAFLFAIFAMTA